MKPSTAGYEEQGIISLEDKGGRRLRRKLADPDQAQRVGRFGTGCERWTASTRLT